MLDMKKAGNGREIDFSGIVTEGFTIPKNSVHKIIFVK